MDTSGAHALARGRQIPRLASTKEHMSATLCHESERRSRVGYRPTLSPSPYKQSYNNTQHGQEGRHKNKQFTALLLLIV
jgi:hypothetical protein